MSKQYSYTWELGTPESLAHQRDVQGKATIDDLLLLAHVNARSADEALPPLATGPEKNNCGDAFMPDPWHASACAERACAYIERARKMLAALATPDAAGGKCARCGHLVSLHTDEGDGCLAWAFDDGEDVCGCMVSREDAAGGSEEQKP